ncbi:MAG: pectate lyase [Isosphaeraceae bacterium]|nr:pectate lyase [Isosphaeraceae bacterium]
MRSRTIVGIRPILSAIVLVGAVASGAGAESFPWRAYAKKPDDWYRSAEGTRAAENVLSHQAERGDWPKNLDTSAQPYTGERAQLRGTFDNGATVGEMRFLARAYVATGRTPYRDAFLKALDHVLAAQYPNGGFPQSFPPGTSYARYITFNDNTMVNLLELLRDVARSDGFTFVDRPRREAAGRAFEAGIACILRCQIKVDGRLTVWCAQHDEKTLEPRGARTFELPSLSGGESAGILGLLMSLDDPSPDVIRSVHAGARWFEASKLTGIRQVIVNGDKKIVPDRDAPPLWARFYEIETNRPFFCGRDGVKKYDIAEIDPERRNGYAWYGDWGSRVAAQYAEWKKKWGEGEGTPGR